MCSTRQDADCLVIYLVDQPVPLVDSAAPIPREIADEWLWFAEALVSVPIDIVEQLIYFFERLPIRFSPISVLPERLRRESDGLTHLLPR